MPQPLTLRTTGTFVLRTPALPFKALEDWSEGIVDRDVERRSTVASAEVWRSTVHRLRARLCEIVSRPEVLQALFIASPSLVSALEEWRERPDGRKGLKAERALVRYFARMCGRPTPFGIFSGCSLGRAEQDDGTTHLEMVPFHRSRTSSRLDFDYLFAVTAGLSRQSDVRRNLLYEPNPTLRRIGDVWHAVESRVSGRARSHHIIKLYNDEFLERAIERARGGARIEELVSALQSLPAGGDLADDETAAYVEELIGSDVLVSNLSPLVTGDPPLDDIVSTLRTVGAAGTAVQTLVEARATLAAFDQQGVGVAPAAYLRLAESLQALPAEVDVAKLVQVDLIRPADGVLGKPVIECLTAGLSVLCRIGQGQFGEPDDLRNFRDSFSARYERAWVPLVEALDEDTGIPFGAGAGADSAPLLRGLQLGARPMPRVGPLSPFHAVLLKKLVERRPGAGEELVIEDAEVPTVENAFESLPEAFETSAVLVAESQESVNAGDFKLVIRGGVGPSGARLMGRFCHVDAAFDGATRRHLSDEEALHPEAVFAEIVYLPEGRIGNVLCRPVLREYEIVCMGRSGAQRTRQLPLRDLWVSVAADGTILLYSETLARRVIPRLTNAHGYMNPGLSPVYRFLAYLQHQRGGAVPSFNWGPLEALDYLPRVRCGRSVLAVARWTIAREEVQGLDDGDRVAAYSAMQRLRERRHLPRWVVLVESDNTLSVDLDNPLCVDALIHVMKRTQQSILQEMYPGPDALCVTSPDGRFAHELLVPFVSSAPRAQSDSAAAAIQRALSEAGRRVSAAARSVLPGGEWLYVKLYGGESSLDDVLVADLEPLLTELSATGELRGWFFIRYADPDPHLRLRFTGRPEWLTTRLLPRIHGALRPLRERGAIRRVQVDTYEREVERYGGPEALAVVEEIFCADSEAALAILKQLEGDEGLEERWRTALLGIHRLFEDCGVPEGVRRDLLARSVDALSGDLRVGATERKRFSDRYRMERSTIESLLEPTPRDGQVLQAARAAFDRRASRIRNAVELLSRLAQSGALRIPLAELATSLTHLHVNRMMRASAKAHEVVMYDFLCRAYEGRRSRTGPRAKVSA